MIEGGSELDTANYNSGANQGVEVNLATGEVENDGRGSAESVGGVERVEGARNQQNTLTGDEGANKLIGGLSNDTLNGGGGADLLRGEPERAPSGASDFLSGGDGDDELFPGLGAGNFVNGDAGADTVSFGALGGSSGISASILDGVGFAGGATSANLALIEHVERDAERRHHHRRRDRRRQPRPRARGRRHPLDPRR